VLEIIDECCEGRRGIGAERGYVPIAELATLTAQVRVGNGLVLPDLEVLLERVELALSLCADTAAALAAFVDDLQHWLPQKLKAAESTDAKRSFEAWRDAFGRGFATSARL
jgi:hypothetical protein